MEIGIQGGSSATRDNDEFQFLMYDDDDDDDGVACQLI
jgi:hypothetical protein